MAQATKTETKTNGAARGKKGDGPVIVSYIDRDGKDAKRVSDAVEAIRVLAKNGKSVEFRIDQLSPSIRNQLVAMAFAKRVDTYVRNSVDIEGTNVVSLAQHIFDGLVAGNIYSRKEGAVSTGRPFDTGYWRAIMAETAKMKKKEVSEKQLDSFEMKLSSMTPADRKSYLAKAKEDKVFALANSPVCSK